PEWKQIPGQLRGRFAGQKLLCADAPGAELTLAFSGTGVGAYVLAGPDAGTVDVSVDDGDFHAVDLYHHFSKGLHYPRTVMFAADLPDGQHTLKLRISSTKNGASRGHAVRMLQFTAN
ncbi:MAG: SGNH/GDSL hydrolase family protein, partial [Planctomycetales bacterium]|nr:SGNH/GDSL hydrolase family protein [Planctomycetales bacterium]